MKQKHIGKWRKQGLQIVLCIGFIVCLCLAAPLQSTSIPTMPIGSGFGARGSYTTRVDSCLHPVWKGRQVYVFHPVEVDSQTPVILFCHGIGADNPLVYQELIRHCVSWGYSVIFSPYQKSTAIRSPLKSYYMMWAGFEFAARHFAPLLDTTRIGFVGHSLGAGAIPSLTLKALNEKKWGSNGCFMYMMAPWYVCGIGQKQLEQFPPSVKCITEIFDNDRINDPRIAIDIFKTIGIPQTEKRFLRLDSDTLDGFVLNAGHDVPEGTYPFGWNVNALDYYGVYRPLHALSCYTFNNDATAKATAFLTGNARYKSMGTWTNGSKIKEIYASLMPDIRYPQAVYLNFWSHATNPRAKESLVFKVGTSKDITMFSTLNNYTTLYTYQKKLATVEEEKEKNISDSLEKAEKEILDRVEDSLEHHEDSLKHAGIEVIVNHARDDSLKRWPIRPIQTGFGAKGQYKVTESFYPHPYGGADYLYCFSPQGIIGQVPVILFAPEIQTTGKKYRQLLSHIASRGYIVISSTYKYSVFLSDKIRYTTLMQGFDEVLGLVMPMVDTTRIGFVGHSYGAGALPAISWHFLKDMKWGEQGAFMFCMSPSYVHGMSQYQFENYPSHVKLLVEEFESDHWNDWRIGQDIFYAININPSEKDFLIVNELRHGEYKINAEYQSPYCESPDDLTPIQYYGIFRPLDALCEYSFTNNIMAKKVALGNGCQEQIFMGIWPDNTAAKPLMSTDLPMQINRLWPHFITANGIPAFFNSIWPFPYSCNYDDLRNERRQFLVPIMDK